MNARCDLDHVCTLGVDREARHDLGLRRDERAVQITHCERRESVIPRERAARNGKGRLQDELGIGRRKQLHARDGSSRSEGCAACQQCAEDS